MKLWIILLASTLMAHIARADIAPNPMSGGVSIEVPGQSQTEIVLERNTVKMRVSPSLCRTRAWFKLRNTGPATQLEVGFPFRFEDEVADFRAWVDNDQQVIEDRTRERKVQTFKGKRLFVDRWKLWPMTFAHDETKLVEVRYSNLTAETGSPYENLKGGSGRAPRGQESLLNDLLSARQIEYTLVTGTYWKGPIGHCRVELLLDGIPDDAVVALIPPAHRFGENQIVWEWSGLKQEPQGNIAAVFFTTSPTTNIIPVLDRFYNPGANESFAAEVKSFKEDFLDPYKSKERMQKLVHQPSAK